MSSDHCSHPVWPTMIASHRGGAMEWPENSPTAFCETAKLSVEYVEFDVHPSRDGVLVVHHDSTLDRTTNGEGPVAEKTFSELRELTLKGTEAASEHMLCLDEVIEIFRPTSIRLRLEIKPGVGFKPYPGIEQQVFAVLKDAGMVERTMITAFFIETLKRMMALGWSSEKVWLVNPLVLRSVGGSEAIGSIARDAGLDEIAFHQETIDSAVLDSILAQGLRLGAYATHRDDAIGRMLDLGVTTFTTDRPTSALALRDKRSPHIL